jgi:hypothetical protein
VRPNVRPDMGPDRAAVPRWQTFVGPDWRPVDVDPAKKMDFSPAEAETLARRCELPWDEPKGLFGRAWTLSAAGATTLGLSREERENVNRSLRELVESTEREFRALYREATGDAAAAARLPAKQLDEQLRSERFLGPVLARLLTVAWERAGKLAAPEHPETLPPRDRALRRLVSIGDDWELALEKIVGAQRAHAVRDATTFRRAHRITGPPECLP